MRALAEFIMRGRFQAALIAAVGNLVPVVSSATVGLVALRKGGFDSLLILFWAVLPVVVIAANTGGVNLLVAVATIAALVVVLLAAQVLKLTLSWSNTLLVCLLGTAFSVWIMEQYCADQVSELENRLAVFFQKVASQAGEGSNVVVSTSRGMLLGVLAYVTLLNVAVSLLVSRWWQAMLYNPGGFREEMHQFRVGFYPALLLMAGVAGCYMQTDYISWASFLGFPLLLGGLCLVHHVVSSSGMGVHWLVMLYVGIVLFGPLSLLLTVVGFADSVLNLRSRLSAKRSSGTDDEN